MRFALASLPRTAKRCFGMRSSGEFGDDVFYQTEAELDAAELNALSAQYP
jgi:hypothetical protein